MFTASVVHTVTALLMGLSPVPVGAAPPTVACPAPVPAETSCYTGQDSNGAFYTIAIPRNWNGSLVMHAHGGPDLGAPTQDRSNEDLSRWSVMVREGYAWAGSSYRRGGFGTQMANEDTENLRRYFIKTFGKPKVTFLHGQSWGGNIASKAAEKYEYDGVLLTNGVLAGGSRGYNYRVDLRVVYQYYCANHPRPSEPQYPLWMGLRKDSTMTTTGLRARLQECTGVESKPEERTPLQQRNLSDILGVTGLPERTLSSHLNFATFTFRDIVHNRLGGRNPFSNQAVWYRGSHDDLALNLGVQRFSADPTAVRDLSYDSDVTGEISVPVLTMHAINDPTAFVEHESAYRASVTNAGNARYLVQTFTRESEHSALSDSGYASAITSLANWVRTGHKPTPASVAAACPALDKKYGTGCFFEPKFGPGSYESKVYPRPGGWFWPALNPWQAKLWSKIPGVGIKP
jgi:pimeloyl-ACP methyl ester carboxylesterase